MRHFVFASILALSACTGGPLNDLDGPTGPMDTVEGAVRTPAGDAVGGATVLVSGQTATTDANGRFTLDVPSTGAPLDVLVRSVDYSVGHTRLDPGARVAHVTVLPLQREQVDISGGALFEAADGVAIDFAPGSVVDADGNPVSGPITVAWSLLNSRESIAAAPGLMKAQQGSSEIELESFGMVDVQLSQNGRPLNLGSPVTLSWPLADTADFEDGETVPLWHFDEDAGLWTREGDGLVADGTFTAEVPHFSWWNADIPASTTCIEGHVYGLDGQPVNAGVVRADGVDYMGTSSASISGGEFKVLVRIDSRVDLVAAGAGFEMDGEVSELGIIRGITTLPTPGTASCLDVGTVIIRDRTMDYDGDGYSPDTGDCNDDDPNWYPGAPETACDVEDFDCNGGPSSYFPDEDGDGYSCVDCDDTRPDVFPGAPDLCDGVLDNDCDGLVDPFEVDDDGDGLSECAGDCDDSSPGQAAACTLDRVVLSATGGCGLRPSLGMTCWGAVAPYEFPAGPIQSLAVNDELACWVGLEGMRCAQGTNEFSPGQVLSNLAGYGDRIAGVRASDGAVAFISSTDSAGVSAGGIQRIALGADHTCVQRVGSVECDGGLEAPSAAVREVVSGDGFSCALDADDAILCWGPEAPGAPAGAFSQLAAGSDHVCALSSAGDLACFGDDGYGQATPPPGTWLSVFAGGQTTCATNPAGSPTCWGRNDLSQATPWVLGE